MLLRTRRTLQTLARKSMCTVSTRNVMFQIASPRIQRNHRFYSLQTLPILQKMNAYKPKNDKTDKELHEIITEFKTSWHAQAHNATAPEVEKLFLTAIQTCKKFTDADEQVFNTQELYDILHNYLFGIQLRNFDPTILANVPKKFQHIKAQDLTGVILNDPNIYAEMIKIYAQNGYPEQVYELIEHIKSQYSAQNQRKTVIKSAKEAFDLIGKAKQFEVEEQPDTVFGLAQPDLFNEEENVFNRKKSQLPQLPNFVDLKVYNHMIDACAALGKIQEVIDIFELIKSRDIEPTIDTFNAVIKSFVPNALTEATLTILEEMHESHVEPTSETLSLVVQIFRNKSDSRFIDIYNGIMYTNPVPITPKLFSEYLTSLCLVYRDVNKALAYINDHKNHINITVDHYNLVLDCCRLSHDVPRTLEIFKLMSAKDSKVRPNSESVNKVLSVIAMNVPSQTQSFYEFISNHESLIADFKPDANTYRARIEGAVRSRDLLSARELVEEMRVKGIEANIDVHTILFWGKYKQDWEPWLDALASRRNQKKSFFQEYSERKIREQSREQSENEFIETNSIQEEQISDFLKTLN